MKITSIPSAPMPTIDTQGAQQTAPAVNLRSLKMNTNATPLTIQPPQEQINSQTEPSAVTQPLSPQLALLAKQRRALQVKERELQDREKVFQSQKAPTNGIDVARLKSEPLRVLLENGVTYDQLTQAIISGQGNSEIDALKSEINSLKQGIDQKFTDKDVQAEQQVLREMKREAEQLARGEEFELIRETRSIPIVMQLIEKTYRKTGEVLDVNEAMNLVENEILQDMQKIARLKKIQSQTPMAQPQQRTYQGMRTLTNKDTASIPMSPKARALAAFYGTLKK